MEYEELKKEAKAMGFILTPKNNTGYWVNIGEVADYGITTANYMGYLRSKSKSGIITLTSTEIALELNYSPVSIHNTLKRLRAWELIEFVEEKEPEGIKRRRRRLKGGIKKIRRT